MDQRRRKMRSVFGLSRKNLFHTPITLRSGSMVTTRSLNLPLVFFCLSNKIVFFFFLLETIKKQETVITDTNTSWVLILPVNSVILTNGNKYERLRRLNSDILEFCWTLKLITIVENENFLRRKRNDYFDLLLFLFKDLSS